MKDVELPEAMQEVMAMQAQAIRERALKVMSCALRGPTATAFIHTMEEEEPEHATWATRVLGPTTTPARGTWLVGGGGHGYRSSLGAIF